MNAKPQTPSDTQAAQRREEERIAHLRACAVEFSGYATLGELAFEKKLSEEQAAEVLVSEWGRLFDAIEATRKA
jgi:hypothetical protein